MSSTEVATTTNGQERATSVPTDDVGAEKKPLPPPFREHPARQLECRLGPVLAAIDGARAAVQGGKPLPDLFGIKAHIVAVRDAIKPRPGWIAVQRYASLVAYLTFAVEFLAKAEAESIAPVRASLLDAAGLNVNLAQNVLWSVYEAGKGD